MKKLALTVCMAFILFAGNAYALWIDVYNPGDILLDSSRTSYTFTHDITDNGFDVGTENVTGFLLTLNLYDDSYDPWYSPLEGASLDITGDGAGSYNYYFILQEFNVAVFGDATLNETGMLTVRLQREYGDFYFGRSTLTAYGNDVAVPEPTTMLLLGLGLVGLAASRRRK